MNPIKQSLRALHGALKRFCTPKNWKLPTPRGIITLRLSNRLRTDMHLIYTYFAFESLQEFFLSIFELFRWVHRAYDEGFVVMAIDSETLAHRSLEVKELFPHFVHGVTYNEKIARIEKALDHYNWSLKQVRDGARVGAAKEFGFEYAPAFKYAKPVTVPSES